MLSQQHDISLEKTLHYPLGSVLWALATPDGCPVKTDKSKLLHHLEKDVPLAAKPPNDSTIYIIDGNAFLQSLTARPVTFEELAEKVFNMLPKVKW